MTPADTDKAPHGPENATEAKAAVCVECGRSFVPFRQGQRFCPTPGARVSACARAADKRNAARGAPALPYLQAWAETRHAKPGTREAAINRYARSELTAIARLYREQDAAAGRGSPVDYIGALMDSASLFVDRLR